MQRSVKSAASSVLERNGTLEGLSVGFCFYTVSKNNQLSKRYWLMMSLALLFFSQPKSQTGVNLDIWAILVTNEQTPSTGRLACLLLEGIRKIILSLSAACDFGFWKKWKIVKCKEAHFWTKYDSLSVIHIHFRLWFCGRHTLIHTYIHFFLRTLSHYIDMH